MIIKQIEFYKGEILELNQFQVCEKTSYIEDGIELSINLHRHVLTPLDDYSNETDEVKAICDELFTQQAKNDYQTFLDSQEA